jgi:hypothetical protein
MSKIINIEVESSLEMHCPGVSVSIEKSEVIFLNEFKKYYQNFKEKKEENDIIFSYLFLQIYIECFLHYKMRRVVEMEFKPPRDSIKNNWFHEKNEKSNIKDKIENFSKLFFSNNEAINEVAKIKDNFKKITNIRNKIAHGYSIGSYSDFNGKNSVSDVKSFLNIKELESQLSNANELGDNWNLLLEKVFNVCASIKDKNLCKFKEIKI